MSIHIIKRSAKLGFLIVCFSLSLLFAESIYIENHSFELPGTTKQKNWENVPAWHSDSLAADSGVETGYTPTEGLWTAFLMASDPSVWNLTEYTIQESDIITLSLDARSTSGADNLQISLYYDDAGTRVTVADSVVTLSGFPQPFSLQFTASDSLASIGHRIGIEIDNTSTGWAGFDNIQLQRTVDFPSAPYPADGDVDIDPSITLTWPEPAGLTDTTYNVYIGTRQTNMTLVSSSQSANSFNPEPDLLVDNFYYWQVEVIDNGNACPGPVWKFFTTRTNGTNFFLDSDTGSDSNSGTSPQQAWATLSKINNRNFSPGDWILFRGGTTYAGQLCPKGSGTADRPIVIQTYDTGPRPRIDGKGTTWAALFLVNQEYWQVFDLEITNTGPTPQAGRRGVHIKVENAFGVMDHIRLINLYVHDVNGSNVKADGGGNGIFFEADGPDARFNDLRILYCCLIRCDRNGISAWSDYCYPWWRWNPSTNVLINGNYLEDIGGDGIVPIGCEGAIVQYNTVRGGRRRAQDYAAGIWPWGCKNTTIQYNEVCYMKGTADGQGFDSDYECSGTTIQYNYSHDNDGGFLLVCAPGDNDYACRDSIIRYNISQNDGSDSRIFHISGKTINTKIYNNVICSDRDNTLILFGNWNGGVPTNTQFYNNIFYITGQADYVWGTTSGTVFDYNVFYGNHVGPPSDAHRLTSDPKFVAPFFGGLGINTAEGYKLRLDSPARDSGLSISDNGELDYWDEPLYNDSPDRGADEFYYCEDFNTDGDIDEDDLTDFCQNWLTDEPLYDLSGDHWVDLIDFSSFAQGFKRH